MTEELGALREMSVDGLRGKYLEVFGEETRSRNRGYLLKKIAWRVQEKAHGGLTERALIRAQELANDADLRVMPPREKKVAAGRTTGSSTKTKRFTSNRDARLPMPGTVLTREYKGQAIQVLVMEKGFEFRGEVFRSLTAIAREITGSHWNGFHFFNLRNTGQ